MKHKSIIEIFVVLFLVCSIFPAFAEDFTNVSECMDITQSGNYRLNQSIFGPQMFSGRDYCVGIFADDVVLDGNGYTLTGDSFGAGINITGNNVVVKNFGDISYYTLGIHVSNSQNFEIVNSTINQNNFHGIVVTFSTQGTIRNSRISGHDWYGVYLDNTTSTRIYNNSINGNYWGLGLYTSSSNFIYLNNFMGNRVYFLKTLRTSGTLPKCFTPIRERSERGILAITGAVTLAQIVMEMVWVTQHTNSTQKTLMTFL